MYYNIMLILIYLDANFGCVRVYLLEMLINTLIFINYFKVCQ